MTRISAALLLALAALTAAAQEQPSFNERLDVNVVLIDAVVTDSKGNQILGLSKDDFVVKEDRAEQTIDSVDYFTSRRLLNAREESAPFRVERVVEERYFVLFFDKPEAGAMTDDVMRARHAAREWIRSDMKPGDRVAIAGHDVRLKIYSDFTGEGKQLERALNDVVSFGPGITKVPGDAAETSILRNLANDMTGTTGTVYEALDVLADALRPIRARKNLVLFSPGIIEPGETIRNGMLVNTSRYYEPMVRSLNAANVSVYALNLLGPKAPSEMLFHQTLQRLASDTGGEYYRNAVSFGPTLDRIENANAGYYLITYRSRKKAGDNGFQKVDVSVRNQEFRVRSRAGYSFGQ